MSAPRYQVCEPHLTIKQNGQSGAIHSGEDAYSLLKWEHVVEVEKVVPKSVAARFDHWRDQVLVKEGPGAEVAEIVGDTHYRQKWRRQPSQTKSMGSKAKAFERQIT